MIELNLLHKKDKDKHPVLRQKLTFGQKASDIVTLIVGSWGFIIGIFVLLVIWMILNVYMVIYRWDPYPFILLNFLLSSLAAIQAPVILMSQNRQAERDRIAAKYDYQVNRKAEREISNMQRDLDKIMAFLKKKK